MDSLSAEDRLTWRTIRKELEDIGITVAAFEANRDFILRWLSHAVETGAFEEQCVPVSRSESLQHSPFASSDNITELSTGVADIDISTKVHGSIEYHGHEGKSDQTPLSNAAPETPLDLVRSFPVNPGVLSIQSPLPSPALPESAVPFVACGRCDKANIAYELHMHCDQCNGGNYDLCLLCWRRGRGCLNWYGFGQSAMARWNRKVDTRSPEPPHFLTGHRYCCVKSPQPPKGQGLQALIETSSPNLELQSGFFCSNCSAFTEFNFWVCDICNDGEWAYCESCVKGGRCCIHPLLPVSFASSKQSINVADKEQEAAFWIPQATPDGRLFYFNTLTGVSAMELPDETPTPTHASVSFAPSKQSIDDADKEQEEAAFWIPQATPDGELFYFNTLTGVSTKQLPLETPTPTDAPSTSSVTLQSSEKTEQVSPRQVSVKCDVCTHSIPPSASRFHCPQCNEGDYDVCHGCYLDLIKCGSIAEGNGPRGWRLCLKGHRMMIVGYEESSRGQRYVIFADLVGGHKQDSSRVRGLFPPSGGVGLHVMALWSYWAEEGDNDELSFPKGAEIRECENINDDWFWGVYCGRKGLFPGNHVDKIEGVHESSQIADSLVTSKALITAQRKGNRK